MKKIVHVQMLPKITGAQQISFDILKGLDSNYEKYIIFGSPSGLAGDICYDDIEKTFGRINVKVIYIDEMRRDISFLDIKALYQLYKIFLHYRFDIVHTNSTKPGVLARVAARLANVKLIVHTVHGISFHKSISVMKRTFYYFAELFSLPFGHFNVTVNSYYLKFYPHFLCKNISILNGVDFSKFYVNDKVSDNSIFKIGFFARLDEQKDPLTFLKVASKIVNGSHLKKKVAFFLAGDGELKQECLSFIETNNLSNFVSVFGWVSDTSGFLNEIDLLCQPSRWEAFGLNIVEAGYFGIPCVASSVEGIPEVINDGITGFLCESGSVSSFVDKVTLLINDENLYCRMSENVRKHVVDKFSASRMVNDYKKIYLEIDNCD